uniref:(northern house mosquito) hypothetical protein n=1 Tax=Culex pipiens TaxID=7175 RepID=A0A8D8KWU9_CULPI
MINDVSGHLQRAHVGQRVYDASVPLGHLHDRIKQNPIRWNVPKAVHRLSVVHIRRRQRIDQLNVPIVAHVFRARPERVQMFVLLQVTVVGTGHKEHQPALLAVQKLQHRLDRCQLGQIGTASVPVAVLLGLSVLQLVDVHQVDENQRGFVRVIDAELFDPVLN